MDTPIGWHNETIGKKVAAALEKNRFTAEYVADRSAALKRVLELVPAEAKVGIGGSVTLEETGIIKALRERGNKLIERDGPGITAEQSLANRRAMLTADVFMTSTNAVTLDGQLVNTDGSGNRVAAMIFGPKKTIIVAGVNKIVSNIDAAMERIELIAAPINNKRIGHPNPCTTNGVCMDCESPKRICNATTILHKRPTPSDIVVILVGEELGY